MRLAAWGSKCNALRAQNQARTPAGQLHYTAGRSTNITPAHGKWALDTALHITVLLHGLYVGVIPIWLHWHDQAVGRHGTTRC
jgi:hypothetical protein